MNPWTVQNVLDNYVDRYSYTDSCSLSFTHDMGTTNIFAPSGTSAYELRDRPGVFSYMTHEQLVNWISIGSLFVLSCGALKWLSQRRQIFIRCLDSLINRDSTYPNERDGVMNVDSDFVGCRSEITTYNSLDASLEQAPRNAYLAVRTWAAYLLLEQVFLALDEGEPARTARSQAIRCAISIRRAVLPDGSLPAILEVDNPARIISTIEGLVFPVLLGLKAIQDEQTPENILPLLRRHLRFVLQPGICLFFDGGWKLSSTSDNSWLSKIHLSSFKAESSLGFHSAQIQAADAIHASWLCDPQNAFWAWSDQMVAGKALGSRFYPRGVMGILWLRPKPR